jgi:hypothetical protein
VKQTQSELDDESPDTDAPIPSVMVIAIANHRDLQCRTGSLSILKWAQRNIGDGHRGKRKIYAMKPKRHSKRLKGKSVRSDGTTKDKNIPTYQVSNGSNSRTLSNDGNDRDDTGGGITSLAAQGGGYKRSLSPSTVDQLTHCTQDQDHDTPTSSKILLSMTNAPVDSSGSSS